MLKDELVGKTSLDEQRFGCNSGRKRRIYDLWKKGQATQEDNKIVRLCRDKIRRAKGQLELNLATAVKENRKCFYNPLATKGRLRISILYWIWGRNTVTKDKGKA